MKHLRKEKVMGELTDAKKAQVQAYVAEYQTIMTRINWFMSMQFVPVGPVVAFLALIGAIHAFFDPILVAWGTAGVAQCAVLTYYFALYEVYNHVRYVETKLKPQLASLLKLETDSFWGYERYLKKFGKANDPLFGDLLPVIPSALAFILAALTRIPEWIPGSGWDCAGLLLTGILLLRTVVSATRVVKVRRDFETAMSGT